jgi:hypothetical protein
MSATPAPSGETRKERRRQYYVGIGCVIALFSLLGNFFLSGLVHSDQVDLQAKDAQIVTLLKQHSVTFAQQQKTAKQTTVFLQDLGILATYLTESNEAVCAATHAACPVLPAIPKIPSS